MRHVKLAVGSLLGNRLTARKQLETMMKTLKALGMASVLALSLSIPAYADPDPGDSHTPGRNDPITDVEGGTRLPNPDTTGGLSAVDTDFGFPTLADILWGLASIY